jgi:uncharacterized protein YndB with AHSA1/START domain
MSVPPVKKQLVVNASQARCFSVFTDGIDRWWPREHHIGSAPLAREVLEPRPGGRWYGLSADGTECEVGKVLVWEPPSRLVLAWQITADWKYDASFVTEVEVVFTALGPKQTRVDFEHRDLERYGVKALDLRKQIDDPKGWHATLDRFAEVAGGE